MLEVKNLVKKYKTKSGIVVNALNGVSLKLPQRGMVFVLGKSGSGKSTLLNVLGGLDKVDSGEIIVKGSPTSSFKQRDFDSYRNTYIGFIFQEYNILEEFTVGANIALAIELQGRKPQEGEIDKILEKVDLTGLANRKPNELSGGQKQRVAIARALVKNPEIIMADEPTGALDSNTGKQIFDLLKELSKEKLVLIVSHDREFSEQYADRIIELADGNIICDDTIDENHIEEEEEENVTYSESEVIVKKGYKLTEEDLIQINEYMDKLNSTLSILPSTVRKQTKTRIQRGFVPTEEDLITLSDDGYKLIKSKLSIKNSFKIASTTLKHKKFRLVVTIFLSVVSFIFFGLASIFSHINRTDLETKSIVDEKISYATFTKAIHYDNSYGGDGYWASNSGLITDEEIETIKDKSGIEVKPLLSISSGLSYTSYYDDLTYFGAYATSSSGFVSFSNKDIAEYGYTLSAGSLPGNNEVCITKYVYDSFSKKGFKEYLTSEVISVRKYEDIIGKHIGIEGTSYTISGIIDTKFDYSSYLPLEEANETGTYNLSTILLKSEISSVNNYSIHTSIFISENEYNTKKNFESKYLSVTKSYLYSNDYYVYLKYTTSYDKIENKLLFGDQTTLEDNEVIVDLKTLLGICSARVNKGESMSIDSSYFAVVSPNVYDVDFSSQEGVSYFIDYFYSYVSSKISSDYVNAHYDEIIANRDENRFGTSDDATYMSNAYSLYLYEGFMNNYGLTQEEKSEIIKASDIYSKALVKALFKGNTSFDVTMEDYYNDKLLTVSVVGTFVDFSMEETNVFVGNDAFENQLIDSRMKGKYKAVVGNMPSSYSKIKKIVQFEQMDLGGVKYELQNSVTDEITLIASSFSYLRKAFLGVATFFAFFACILFSTFIASSIAYKKRDIGVLRAIGSRSNDVFRIFFAESFIIAMINYVLALICTGVISSVISTNLKRSTGLKITFLSIGPIQFLLLFAISLGVAIIATYLPVLKIASKKPVDAIRNK